MPEMPRRPLSARKEIWALVIVAVLIAAVFLIHPMIQRQLVNSPEPGGAPVPGTTAAQSPPENSPAAVQGD